MRAQELGDASAFASAGVRPDRQKGMTMRQHYAGLALQGLLANPDPDVRTASRRLMADMAVSRADALLFALATCGDPISLSD